MSKPINVNVIFNTDHHIFSCKEEEFPHKVSDYFKIDLRKCDVYAVKGRNRQKIKLQDICDVMKIEIVPKNGPQDGGQRTLRSYYSDEPVGMSSTALVGISSTAPVGMSSTAKKENIIDKLIKNTPLSGFERKALVEWLQGDIQVNSTSSSSLPKKRKIDDISVSHKKLQVDISSFVHKKDSFTQTDFVHIEHDPDPEEESIPIKLKKLAYKGKADPQEVERLMELSFEDRRQFIILKNPMVHVVKDKYPSLFDLKEVKNELDRLYYPGKCIDFVNNMTKYSTHILSSSNSEDEIYLLTQKIVAKVHTEHQKTYARTVGSIFLLAKILEEDWRFIHLSDYPHGSSDIYPHIDGSIYSLKDVFYDNYVFPVIIEDQRLCEATNLLEAILCLVAAFFIFNVNYPDSCCRTLIVFEKLFLCGNDTTDIDEMTSQMIKLLELKASNKK